MFFSGSPVIYEPTLPVYVQEGGQFTLKCRYEDDLDTGVQWYFKCGNDNCKDKLIDASEGTGFEIENRKKVRFTVLVIDYRCSRSTGLANVTYIVYFSLFILLQFI